MALPKCGCKHVDYCGKCMNENRIVTAHKFGDGWSCLHHGALSEQDIVRAFPDGHECGYA